MGENEEWGKVFGYLKQIAESKGEDNRGGLVNEKKGAMESAGDDPLLERILNGSDVQAVISGLEDLIGKREELKREKLRDVDNEKEKVRDLLARAASGYKPEMQKELPTLWKQYLELSQIKAEEEIQAWKDVSLLHIKLLEAQLGFLGEGTGGGEEPEMD